MYRHRACRVSKSRDCFSHMGMNRPHNSRYGYHAMKCIFVERSLRQSLNKMYPNQRPSINLLNAPGPSPMGGSLFITFHQVRHVHQQQIKLRLSLVWLQNRMHLQTPYHVLLIYMPHTSTPAVNNEGPITTRPTQVNVEGGIPGHPPPHSNVVSLPIEEIRYVNSYVR